MNVSVMEDVCWVCGKAKSKKVRLTRHHTIPQHLKPKKNIVVPVCEGCHRKINESDVTGMYAHAVKLSKSVEGLGKQMNALNEVLKGHVNRQKVKEK